MYKKYFLLIVLTVFFITACINEPSDPRELAVAGVSLDITSMTLNLWFDEDFDKRKAVLTSSIIPEKASPWVTWESSDETVARVKNGLVTAAGVGTADIIVTTKEGGHQAQCRITVVNQKPQPVQAISLPSNLTLYLGGTSQKILTPVFTPYFVTNENITWMTSNSDIARVSNGVVTGVRAGTITITAITAENGLSDTCTVYVIPLQAQFNSISDFLLAANSYYKPGFDFGTAPSAASSVLNTSTWSGTSPNNPDFTLIYNDDETLGNAGEGNLVPKFVYPKNGSDFVQAGSIDSGPYRSHTQFNYASLAHYAFTWFRQAHPWGIMEIPTAPATTRAGQTWCAGISAYTANTNTVQFTGLGVDLGSDTLFDTVVIYAGSNINAENTFNTKDSYSKCPNIILEYMSFSADNQSVFNNLYKANSNEPVDNWNNPNNNNNWLPPGFAGSPWISGGKIVPEEPSWVYVFHFEHPVLARYLRCNFEQAKAVFPATGYIGRAMVNSFEVYNTKVE